jgi:hypothetical protein
MIYNLKHIEQRKALIERVKFETRLGMTVEFKRYSPKRSGKQNRYLHLLLGLVAIDYCDTVEYVKTELYKRKYNRELYEYEVTNKDGKRMALKSSSALSEQEMAVSIDRLRDGYMQDKGCYLPEANEDFTVYENEINKYKRWL